MSCDISPLSHETKHCSGRHPEAQLRARIAVLLLIFYSASLSVRATPVPRARSAPSSGRVRSATAMAQRALPVVSGVQVAQRGPAAGVAHALHQLAQVRLGVRDQPVPGVPQIVKVNVGQAGNGDRGQPRPAPDADAHSVETQRASWGRAAAARAGQRKPVSQQAERRSAGVTG
jgi:hypothetical protein